VLSPSILEEEGDDSIPVKQARDSFASREAEFQKLALDDQQTLALNELLLQVTEMKRKMVKLEADNNYLRTQVTIMNTQKSATLIERAERSVKLPGAARCQGQCSGPQPSVTLCHSPP
jgi:hypothetical protein